VPPRDPQALARAIRDMLNDPAAASKLGAAGRALVQERFTVDRMVAHTTATFDAAMQNVGERPPVQKRVLA
jgi:glycosyltransferase involved in cell wall biosynthesis